MSSAAAVAAPYGVTAPVSLSRRPVTDTNKPIGLATEHAGNATKSSSSLVGGKANVICVVGERKLQKKKHTLFRA